jgi:hypothetical protein
MIMITIASSAVTLRAVYCLQSGVVGSLVIYNVGLAAGVINASRPLLAPQTMDGSIVRSDG